MRGIKRLRIEEGVFSSERLMQQCSLSEGDVSNRTIRRYLNRNGFKFLQARKKRLLSEKDKRERLTFARSMRRDYSRNVWEKEIAFYLDATSFVYKRHPMDQARAPRGRIWRKISEGLDPGCTAKGRKEGSGGKIVHIMAAISYGQLVLIAEPFVKMNGQYFESFIDNDFEFSTDFSVQTTLMEDIDYGFKTAIRHRIVLEQKELCHAQTQFYYQFRQEVRI